MVHVVSFYFSIDYCFLDSEDFQEDDTEQDDESVRRMIQRRIEQLERRLETWRTRRQRLHQ